MALWCSIERRGVDREAAARGYTTAFGPSGTSAGVASGAARAWIAGAEPGSAAAGLVRGLREAGVVAPIVAIVNGTSDLVAALDAGAMDCVRRPLDFSELFARLQVVLRYRPPPASRVPFARLAEFVLDDHGLRHPLGDVALRPAELRVLQYLVTNRPRLVSGQELLREVLGVTGDGGSVRTHVWEIRRKLRAAGLPDLVRTVRGAGYRVVASGWDVPDITRVASPGPLRDS